MGYGVNKLRDQVARLPLDRALREAVLDGVENTDDATAAREAESLEQLFDRLPAKLQAVRDAVAAERLDLVNSVDRTETVETQVWDRPARASREYAAVADTIALGHDRLTLIADDTDRCPHCGQCTSEGLEQFLGRLGISEEMLTSLRSQFQTVDIDTYLDSARDYLKDSTTKASTYAQQNPGRVAMGVAAFALGAGLLYAALNKDKT